MLFTSHSILGVAHLYLVSIAQKQCQQRPDRSDAMLKNDYVIFLRDADFTKTDGACLVTKT